MVDVTVRAFKEVPLAGGTLVVSIPHVGVGSLILTDFILESLNMDQIACLDSDAFPAIAMMRRGKPRFPVRIHADPRSGVAVLRCEFSPVPGLIRPLARAILDWAHARGIAQVIALDGLMSPEDLEPPAPQIFVAAGTEHARQRLAKTGLREFDEGILGGVAAMLLLEARFLPFDVLTLFSAFDNPVDDARASLELGEALKRLLPEFRPDLRLLEQRIEGLQADLRAIQAAAEKALARMTQRKPETSMYG